MELRTAQPEVLLALDLAYVNQSKDKVLAVITECGGHEIGTSERLYVVGWTADADGAVGAATCAQRLQLILPAGAVSALHVGEPSGEGLAVLLAIRRATASGGVTASAAVVALGGASLPIALEPQMGPKGPTGFHTMVRTQFIDMSARPAEMAGERTSTKLIYARNGAAALKAPEKKIDESVPTREPSIFSVLYDKLPLGIILKLSVAVGMYFVYFHMNESKDFYERLKGDFYSKTSFGRKLAESSAKLDAKLNATTAAILKPVELAKKAADQAATVSPELLALAPEIKAADVNGKSGAPIKMGGVAAALAGNAAAASAAAGDGEKVAAPAAAGGTGAAATGSVGALTSPSGARTTASAEPASSSSQLSDLENSVLAKCSTDPGFCHTSGLAALKDGRAAVGVQFFSASCDQGFAKSCAQLADMYQTGLGVERSSARARAFHEKACLKGAAPSCTALGIALLQEAGTPDALKKGRASLERGCEQGDGPACLLLGIDSVSAVGTAAARPTAAARLSKGCQLMSISGCAP